MRTTGHQPECLSKSNIHVEGKQLHEARLHNTMPALAKLVDKDAESDGRGFHDAQTETTHKAYARRERHGAQSHPAQCGPLRRQSKLVECNICTLVRSTVVATSF